MNLYAAIFYLLAAILLVSTAVAITRRDAIHAVVYLMISFIATGLIFYLLGAPFLALLEIIIYAGAIMVLFLFIVMMLRLTPSRRTGRAALSQWAPAMVLGGISLILAAVVISAAPAASPVLKGLTAGPRDLARFLFQKYWFPVEIASFLLLIALVGALFLGRQEKKEPKTPRPEGL
jgi:NADH-quinone oxidoreductase subunit J